MGFMEMNLRHCMVSTAGAQSTSPSTSAAVALWRRVNQRDESDLEEPAATRVETALHARPTRGPPTLGQFPRRRESHLVQHATAINVAVDLIERTAQPGNDGWIRL